MISSFDSDVISDDFIGTGKHVFTLNNEDTTLHEALIE